MFNYLRSQLIILLAFSAASASFGQSENVEPINLSGKWAGTSNWGSQQMTMRIDLDQEGNLLEGRVRVETLNKQKAATYLVNGFVKEANFFLDVAGFSVRNAG